VDPPPGITDQRGQRAFDPGVQILRVRFWTRFSQMVRRQLGDAADQVGVLIRGEQTGLRQGAGMGLLQAQLVRQQKPILL
jgi:hypothetical protein